MGVSALFHSAITGLSDYLSDASFLVMDNGLGKRSISHILDQNRTLEATHVGARAGRKYYRPENIYNQYLSAHLGAFGARINPIIKQLDSCDVILDISGGDSFSDIYGAKRFLSAARPKLIALKRQKPLILLPQTYGPYNDPRWQSLAQTIVRGADMAWARDIHSFEILKSLLGDHFDANKHRCGIDLAFRLTKRGAAHEIGDSISEFIAENRSERPLIGFNVSGLIYQSQKNAKHQYGFKADYNHVIAKFLQWALTKTTANIVLIPHVMDVPGHYESDFGASLEVLHKIETDTKNRVEISPNTLDQSQTKWLISKMDWFCGTRMHSTIAGLSQGVPTCAISYSDKTLGVFASCNQQEQVADPRITTTDEMVAHLKRSFLSRDVIANSLEKELPQIREKSEQQLQHIVEMIKHCQGGS